MGTLPAARADALRQESAGMFQKVTAPSTVTLRDYQLHDLSQVRQSFRTHRSVVLVQPTGAGKGTLASFIVQSAVQRGNSVIFMVNRRPLVRDMSKRLDRLGIDHGVIMGDDKRRKPWLSVHVASIDTLHRRPNLPKANLLIIDEAHFAVSDTWLKVVQKYPDAKVLGMTATPVRLDGRGLGEMFDVMVKGPSVAELIERKFLVPSRTFAPSAPDLNGVKKTAGDFNQKALAEVCDQRKLTGDIVEHWKKLSMDRKTVSFGVNKAHAQHIAEQFRCAGYDCAYVDSDTSDEERDKVWDDLDNGNLRVVSSVGIISYGWDHPIVSTVVLARPTASLGLHLQQIGRGSRPYPGKDSLLVLDHAANTHRHGFYEDSREWKLEGKALAGSDDDEKPISVSTCPQCFASFRMKADRKCPVCGYEIPKPEREVEVEEGQLEEFRPRVVCDLCKREMEGAKEGDRCFADGPIRYGACPGRARRAFQIKELSKNPKIAEIQRVAQERGYRPGYVFMRIQELKRRGQV